MPGQRSFDAAGIFGRRREQREPRRAVSEDQQRDMRKSLFQFFQLLCYSNYSVESGARIIPMHGQCDLIWQNFTIWAKFSTYL